MAAKTTPFSGAPQKLKLTSKDHDPGTPPIQVIAQYNPKELQISQQIGWQTHATTNAKTPDDTLIEFHSMEPATAQVELLFDGYEDNGAFRTDGSEPIRVAQMIARLKQLAAPKDPSSTKDARRRPYQCLVTWGPGTDLPSFLCVIESLVVKYTMMGPNGEVLRAVCTVGLKEANLQRTDLVREAEEEQAKHDREQAQRRAS